MTKKLFIREAWVLDENGDRLIEIVPFSFSESTDMKEAVGGFGEYNSGYIGYLERRMTNKVK